MNNKMSSDVRAHRVCEEYLTILRRSKLNYMVKETPYSAYITIRKKFVKDCNDLSNVTFAGDANKDNLNIENCFLKQRCKDLEDQIKHLEVESEEVHSKLKPLDKEIEKLTADSELNLKKVLIYEEKINIYEKQSDVKDELLNDSEVKREFISSQLHQIKSKLNKSEEALKNSLDDNAILKGIVENKENEIKELGEKYEHFEENTSDSSLQKCETKFTCDMCNFNTNNEKGLKIHTRKMHEIKCTSCDVSFQSEAKLKEHTCRLHISNPSYKSMYMKDWFVKDSCIRVYDSGLQKEIALLHSDFCKKCEPCADYPTSFKRGVKYKDNNELIHLNAGTYFERNSIPEQVDWDVLNYNMHYYEE